ncbi:putative diacylglycerol O-acyltransferase tgs1 [Rhodotorula kratochvilovae]
MRRGQRQNAITNSPVVRSFIRPVLTAVPTPSSSAAKSFIASETLNYTPDEAAAPDERWLIPTQPSSLAGGADDAGTSDVKGKKRAREDDGEGVNVPAKEYDAEKGTRFGVTVRYAEGNLPAELEKYWAQRYRLFSLYDEGCEMDREGWFSVTPENIAAQIAERCRSGVIVDAFCGVGGNAIQFAFTCEKVIALDTSPVRLACAAHNARLYGVADRITFILGDWVAWTEAYAARLERGEVANEDKVEVVFLSPPWGGIEYQTTLSTAAVAAPPAKKRRVSSSADAAAPAAEAAAAYPLSALAPLPGADLFSLARRCTKNVALFLPRNVDLLELASLPGLGADEKVEIEEEWMGWKCKAVTAYFGELAVGNGYVEQAQDGEE